MVTTIDAEQVRNEALGFFRESELLPGWEWVELLSPVHQRLFAVELADAVKEATITGDAASLLDLLDDWQATAELDAAPEVLADVRRPKQGRPLAT